MKRRRTPGVVFAYEGLKSTPEASDKKLTSRLEKRREGSPSNSWATDSIENKNPR